MESKTLAAKESGKCSLCFPTSTVQEDTSKGTQGNIKSRRKEGSESVWELGS